ncbi:hypothetical protein PG987_008912 [Apiospora arundinis]
MEAAYKTYMGRRTAEVELFKNEPKPTQADAQRANLVISSADEECIFIIYHTSKDAQATARDQEEHSSTGKGVAIRVRLGRPFSELRALWRDFRLARAARREFKGREETRETKKNQFITFKDKKIPWTAKGTAISWKLVHSPK